MATVEGIDQKVKQIIIDLGIPFEDLKELHLHFVPDDVVHAEAIYFLKLNTPLETENVETALRKYVLTEVEHHPITLGGKVKIRAAFEKDSERGKKYYVTQLDEDNRRAFIRWVNFLDPNAKPFWIDLKEIEGVL
jgi:hypothetical protein